MANEILKFAETDNGTNLLTQVEYDGDAQRPIGNQAGIARSKLVNKVLRQTTFMSKVFGDYLSQQTGDDILDNADDTALLDIMTQAFATGIPVGAIVKMPTSDLPSGFLKTNGAAISRTTYGALFDLLVTSQGFVAEEFTVTLATPAVFTKVAHGFKNGERLRLFTTGTLPTGLSLATDYFVVIIDDDTFNLQTFSDVLAGTLIATSGVQSGTHTYLRSLWGLGDGTTTFNVPDLRGVFERAWDDARGLDPDRAIASFQLDALQGHGHVLRHGTDGGAGGSAPAGTGGGGRTNSSGDLISVESLGGFGTVRTASETRPISHALMPVIKF